MNRRYIVMTSKAKMPCSCWGTYRNVAVVETDGRTMPRMIHPRHNAVLSIPWFRGRLFRGRTKRCAFARALAEAHEVARRLNEEAGGAESGGSAAR